MAKIVSFLFLLFTLLPCLPAYGRQPAPPLAGIGVLTIRPSSPDDTAENINLTLYESPGVKRIAEVNAKEIPLLFSVDETSPGEFAAAVTGKTGEWLRIAYDDAGREGWVRMKRRWRYAAWSSFLKDRHAVLLPGFRRSDYDMREDCSDNSGVLASLSGQGDFRIIGVEGDWATVRAGLPAMGCIRWRSGDGRLMISVVKTGP